MNDFEVHWNRVCGPRAEPYEASGRMLCAIWPAPVNPDECFAAAGCDRLGEQDDAWDHRAEALLDRLTVELSRLGPPRLASEPLRSDVPWYARWFRTGEPLPLRQQLLQPIHWDSLPRCRVAFGDSGQELFAGDGHHIYWFTWPVGDEPGLAALAGRIASPWPTYRTQLRWEHLLPESVA